MFMSCCCVLPIDIVRISGGGSSLRRTVVSMASGSTDLRKSTGRDAVMDAFFLHFFVEPSAAGGFGERPNVAPEIIYAKVTKECIPISSQARRVGYNLK